MLNSQTLIQMIKNGQNPQQLMISILQQGMGQSPLGQNLLNLAQKGDSAAIEQIARNMCAQQGKDFDTEFNTFKKTMGLK